jgi:hypothetical protein
MDEMERAHRNDYEYEKKLREARTALRKVFDENRLSVQGLNDVEVVISRLTDEMAMIVKRWD